MSIRPVDFNGMIQNTHEVSQAKANEDNKANLQQQNVQVAVMLIQPVQSLLQCMAGAHAAGAWIRVDQLLGSFRRLKEGFEFGREELEVAHG